MKSNEITREQLAGMMDHTFLKAYATDADFEKLKTMGDRLSGITVTGIRAAELAMRFKYAGIPTEKIRLLSDYKQLLETVIAEKTPVYIMPTYTAMLEIREVLSRDYSFKEFWK